MERQLAALRAAIAGGAPRLGWKVGINVPSVQRSLGLDHALVGWLDGRAVLAGDAVYAISPGALPHAEPELAIRLGAPVSPSASPAVARAAIASVAPALEIVDYARGGMELDDLLAHSMFHAATVLGEMQPLSRLAGTGRDWPILRPIARDGEHSFAPSDALVPADLGVLVAAVARYLGEFGESLLAGDTILSGSFTERAVRLAPGTRITADFGPLGPLSLIAGK